MRSHGGVETTLEDKTFLFWKPTSFKSHETRILSGGICFGLRTKDDLNFALKTTLCVGFSWFELSFRTYCKQSLVRLGSNGGLFAATQQSQELFLMHSWTFYYQQNMRWERQKEHQQKYLLSMMAERVSQYKLE